MVGLSHLPRYLAGQSGGPHLPASFCFLIRNFPHACLSMGQCISYCLDSCYINCANRRKPQGLEHILSRAQTGMAYIVFCTQLPCIAHSQHTETGDLLFLSNSGSWHLRCSRPGGFSHCMMVYKEDDFSGLPACYQQQLRDAGVKEGTPLIYEATGAPIIKQWAPQPKCCTGCRIIPVTSKLEEYFATEVGVLVGYRPLLVSQEARQKLKQTTDDVMQKFENTPFKLEARDAVKAACNCPCQASCECCYLVEKQDRIHCSSLLACIYKEAGLLPEVNISDM